MKSNLKIFFGICLGIVSFGAGAFGYQYFKHTKNNIACTMEAKICPDGSAVGRQGPKCEFAECPLNNQEKVFSTKEECEAKLKCKCNFAMCDYVPEGKTFEEVCGKDFEKGWQCDERYDRLTGWEIYTNREYGFKIEFPQSWSGYYLEKNNWQGQKVDSIGKIGEYNGVELILKNPQTTPQQKYQDIPIMVFTHDIWKLVEEEKIAVSAAPIGPAKIGENSKYIFATPPRWYGFTDAIGYQEAIDIIKTFKTFDIK